MSQYQLRSTDGSLVFYTDRAEALAQFKTGKYEKLSYDQCRWRLVSAQDLTSWSSASQIRLAQLCPAWITAGRNDLFVVDQRSFNDNCIPYVKGQITEETYLASLIEACVSLADFENSF